MSQANKDLAERFHMDIFVAGRLEAADEILSADFTAHPPVHPDFARGPNGVKLWANTLRSAIPDMAISHSHVTAEGDLVTVRWESSGTHNGALMGVPPSGNFVRTSGIDLFRIADGRIAELWQEWDSLGFMQQIGAFGSAAAADAPTPIPAS
jgi:steroid delta-isomerase-like uncharacterized protein